MFQRILVPLDDSKGAEEALPMAAYLARATKASLVLAKVVSQDLLYINPSPMVPEHIATQIRAAYIDDAKAYLKDVIRDAHLEDMSCLTEVVVGSPGPALIQIASQHLCDLIVMRSQGQTGITRWLFGSVARYLVRHSAAPVLVLHDAHSPSAPHTLPGPRVLIPLDGSPEAESVLPSAAEMASVLAGSTPGHVHLLCVARSATENRHLSPVQAEQQNRAVQREAESYLEAVAERLRIGDLASFGLGVTYSVMTYESEEEIWKRIVEQSEDSGGAHENIRYELIAMATHGRGVLQRLQHESVTERVLDRTAHPLLIVHEPCLSYKYVPDAVSSVSPGA